MGNHLVGFRFEGENQDNKQVVMSFKTFYFKNGSGKQSITCKVDTCDGPCDKGTLFDLTYGRVVVHLGTSDEFSLRFFSKPSEPTELQNQELTENS